MTIQDNIPVAPAQILPPSADQHDEESATPVALTPTTLDEEKEQEYPGNYTRDNPPPRDSETKRTDKVKTIILLAAIVTAIVVVVLSIVNF